jgi:hypothetical protein
MKKMKTWLRVSAVLLFFAVNIKSFATHDLPSFANKNVFDKNFGGRLFDFTVSTSAQTVYVNWKASAEIDITSYDIEYSENGIEFLKAGTVYPRNTQNSNSYSFAHNYLYTGNLFYRIKITYTNGFFNYSDVISTRFNTDGDVFVYPSIVNNGLLHAETGYNFKTMELYNMSGQLIWQKDIRGHDRKFSIYLPSMPPGFFIVRLSNDITSRSFKIMIH